MKLRELKSYSNEPRNYFGLFLFLMVLGFSGGLLGNYLLRNALTTEDSLADVTQTFTICPEGQNQLSGCDFYGGDGIQEAIDRADGDGETILIRDGNYTREDYSEFITNDNKRLKCFVSTNEGGADKNLIIKGEINTVLDGTNSEAMNGICAKGNTLIIQNLTLVGFKSDPASCFPDQFNTACSTGTALVLVGNVNTTIRANKIYNNGGAGIDARFNAILNNFKSNLIYSNNAGVVMFDNTQLQSVNNTIYNNVTDGIFCGEDSVCSVKNTVVANSRSYGFRADKSTNFNEISYNVVFNNTAGNFDNVISETIITGGNNVYQNPGFINPATNDLHLMTGSPAINTGDPALSDADNSRSDIGGYGGTEACSLDRNLRGCDDQTPPPTTTPCVTPDAMAVMGIYAQMNMMNGAGEDDTFTQPTPTSAGSPTLGAPTATPTPASTVTPTATQAPCPTPGSTEVPEVCLGISDIDCNNRVNIRDFQRFVEAVKLQREGYEGDPQDFQVRSDINEDDLVNIADFIPFKEEYVELN